MNYILTCSRSGSTIYSHSFNAAIGMPLDIDITKPEVDTAIGEHAHEVCHWSVDEILNANVMATKVKPEAPSFRPLISRITDTDRIIWYRRDTNDLIRSFVTREILQMHHFTTKEEEDEYFSRMNNVDVDNIEFDARINRLTKHVRNNIKDQEKILQSVNAITLTVWHENFMRNPAQIIERSANFFRIPMVENKGMLTDCKKLPEHPELSRKITERLIKYT
jgi:ribosomal protein S15P/S13E